MTRPTIYNDELAEQICRRIADGESLHRICADSDMPSRSTVLLWLRSGERPEFLNQYLDAKDAKADFLADQVLEIADGCEGAERNTEIQAARLRIEARQWYSKVTAPKKYSDRLAVDQKTEHRTSDEMTPEQARAILLEHGIDPEQL
ncbi:hypothetical protein [Microbulbifer marinus]|uniref:Phage terminase small subunit n=1 Tax=Microbulbifer marinus TaxID=658218 RepID=A0A1H3YZ93_9GAMM|nr:hypothetical protein [Microbulbifer marinus]SEA16458.1 hypothetical protein SAMN05216562_2059 [Microbulbifer marinus]